MRNKDVLMQILRIFLGELVCIGLMLAVYAFLGRLTPAVLLGAGLGGLIAAGNFAALSITVANAADRAAETGEAKKAQLIVQGSSAGRLLAVALIYILLLKTGKPDPIAALLPLVFVQVSIPLTEFFRKDGKK